MNNSENKKYQQLAEKYAEYSLERCLDCDPSTLQKRAIKKEARTQFFEVANWLYKHNLLKLE